MTAPADLPAGGEMDRLVAERVMGWVRSPLNPRQWFSDEGNPVSYINEWCPSIDIADAWLALERFQSRDPLWEWDLTYSATHGWFECWINNGAVAVESMAETAPLAICRAALAAVGAG